MPSTGPATTDRNRLKIDRDASTDDHYKCIRSLGQQYLLQAARQDLPAPTRQRILQASLRYLDDRVVPPTIRSSQMSPHIPSSQSLSQHSPGVAAASATTPHSSFQSVLTPLIDHTIPAHTLIDACAKATDLQLLPILAKCLAVLSTFGHIRDVKCIDGHFVVSQSQYLDHELLSTQQQNPNPNDDAVLVHPHRRPAATPMQTALPPDENNTTNAAISVHRTGPNFVDDFVSKLVAGPPPTAPAKSQAANAAADVFVSSVAREAPLTPHAAQNVLRLLTRRIRTVPLFELPAYVYQLLLFASAKGNASAKGHVLLHIADVFAEHDAASMRAQKVSQTLLDDDEDAIVVVSTTVSDVRQVQGTALLHIQYATKQDPSLASEVIRLMKAGVENPRHFLSAFGAGVALLQARTASMQTDVLQLLREAIARFDKERYNREHHLFAARVTMNDDPLLDPRKSLLKIAESTCEHGWDFVKESLLELSFVLLDKPLQSYADHSAPHEDLSTALIINLFESHPAMRAPILEQLLSRVALLEKAAMLAISILSRLSCDFPYFMLDHHSLIRDFIELLPTLPPWLAAALMQAIKPFFTLRQDVYDIFHLTMRKSLFHRENSSRAVAVCGFLTIVSMAKLPGMRSQPVSQIASPAAMSQRSEEEGVNAIVELIQPLRRVFSFPAVLRAFMYKHIIQTLREEESEQKVRMRAAAFGSVLLGHVRRFIDAEKAPHVLVDMCVDESIGGCLVEPLGDLLWCLAVIESLRDADVYHKSHIIDLARKVSSVSLRDYAVTKEPLTGDDGNDGADESGRASVVANRNKVRVLGSVVEALIHSLLILPRHRLTWSIVSEVLIPLLMLKGKVFDLLRVAGVASAGETFRDLGGDAELEPLRPGMRLVFHRGSKAGGGGKKGGGRKSKGGEQGAGPGSTQGGTHRFGAFSILTSGHTKPALSLQACLRVLEMMADAASEEAEEDGNAFIGRTESKDFQDLRVYLLAVAQKHVDEFVLCASKWNTEESAEKLRDDDEMVEAVNLLVMMAMSDFKTFRRASGDVGAQGGLKALQIAESCAATLPVLGGDASVVTSFCKAILPPATDSVFNDHEGTFETACVALEKLVESLLGDGLSKEVTVALQIYEYVTQSVKHALETVEKRAKFLDERLEWAVEVVASQKVTDSAIVKTLVQSCLVYTENNNDLRRTVDICERLLFVIKDCNENVQIQEAPVDAARKLVRAAAVEKETGLATVDAVCDVLERGSVDVEWCLGRMSSLETILETQLEPRGDLDGGGAVGGSEENMDAEKDLGDMVVKQAMRAEDAGQTRLECVMRAMRWLCRCAIGKWRQQERVVRLATKMYKMGSLASQAQTKRKGEPRASFKAMLEESKAVTPNLWTFLAFVGTQSRTESGGGGGEGGGAKGAAKTAKEARIMPQLVYEVERFEKVLIGVNKRTKTNLLRGMRRHTARDFRISEDKLPAEDDDDQQQQDEQENEEDEDDGAGDGNDRRVRKRGPSRGGPHKRPRAS